MSGKLWENHQRCCLLGSPIVKHGKLTPIQSALYSIVFNALNIPFSRAKQEERQQRIKDLDPRFHEPLNASDRAILDQYVQDLVSSVKSGTLEATDILTAYGKKALKAHEATNCLTEIMIDSAVNWAQDCNKNGPLAGIPISLKDVRSKSDKRYFR